MKMEIRIKKIPFANPDKVCIRSYLNVAPEISYLYVSSLHNNHDSPISPPPALLPTRHNTRPQPHPQSRTIKSHMNRITNQSQRIRPRSPKELYKEVRQIEEKEIKDRAGFVRVEDGFEEGSECGGKEG